MRINEYIHPTIPFLFAEFEKYIGDEVTGENIPIYRLYNGHKEEGLLLGELVIQKMGFVNKDSIISEFEEKQMVEEIKKIMNFKQNKIDLDLKIILRKYLIKNIKN